MLDNAIDTHDYRTRYLQSCQLNFTSPNPIHHDIGSGIIAVIVSDPNQLISDRHTHTPFAWGLSFAIALICNMILNIFGTLNIVIRLILHRRSVNAAFGQSSVLTKDHGFILNALLESAALNIPVMLLAITPLLLRKEFLIIGMAVTVHGQVCGYLTVD